MHVFRPLTVLLACGLVLAGGAADAGAKTLVKLSGTVSPAITAFTLKPQTLSLSFDAAFSTDTPGELPGTITKATILFPHGPRVNGALFPSCNPTKLKKAHGSSKACPRGSRLGSGSALGTSPEFNGDVKERLKVSVYNGPKGKSLLFYLEGQNPVQISGLIDAPFQAIHSHMWGYRLTLPVPQNLQQISRGIFASLLDFKTTVGGSVTVKEHGRRVRHGYIEVLTCPPGALVPVSGSFKFRDGSSARQRSFIGCGK